MLIAISILIFILIYVYLKYQKNLAQIEIEKEKEYRDMMAKKEYAEKILSIVANGNISVETEHRLLKSLDEIIVLLKQRVHLHETQWYNLSHPNPILSTLISDNFELSEYLENIQSFTHLLKTMRADSPIQVVGQNGLR